MYYSQLYEGVPTLDPRGLQSWQFGWESLSVPSDQAWDTSPCFNIVTSKPRLFQRLFTCMYGSTQSELYSQASACYSQRGEWAAFTLSCSHSFGLILNISGSKTETRKAKFSRFIFVCNLQMLFLPFQTTEKRKKTKEKKKKHSEAHSDVCGCWQLFELTEEGF